MLIPKFYNVREFVGSAMDGAGYILIRNTFQAEVVFSKELLTDVQKLTREIVLAKEQRLSKPGLLYKELQVHKFDLDHIDIFIGLHIDGNKKQILRTLKVYAEGGSLELPEADNAMIAELSENDKRLVLKQREVQLLNVTQRNISEIQKVQLFCVTHPEESDFIYFGSITKDIATIHDFSHSLLVYWKDSKREGYTNNGIKAVFESKTLVWYSKLNIIPLGTLIVFDKEHRLPYISRLIELAVLMGYNPVNRRTDRYEKIRFTEITMQGPIVEILLWGNLNEYLNN